MITGVIIGLFTGAFFVGEFNAGVFGYFLLEAIVILIITPIIAFIGHAIMFCFYNFVAGWVGGIEFELKDVE